MQQYLKKIESRQLLLMLSGFTLLFATILITSVVKPQIKEYRNTLKSHGKLTRASNNNQDFIKQLELEKTAIAKLNKNLHSDMANLPLNQIESYIIGRLQQISWQHNIELTGITPSAGEKINSFQEIIFNVNLSGSYFNLYSWISDLNNELGFTVIKKFEMHPIKQNKVNPELMATLTMASYFGAKR